MDYAAELDGMRWEKSGKAGTIIFDRPPMNTISFQQRSQIAKLIETQGPLSIAQFMTIALHDPSHGYYAARDPLGARGDFITAPEISQIFGELVGLWLAEVWQQQDKPGNAQVVELGPGRGTLMADALRAVRRVPGFLDAIEIVLVETDPVLRDIQRERLKASGASIRWSERYEAAECEGRVPIDLPRMAVNEDGGDR